MKRKWMCILLCAALAVTLMPLSAFAETDAPGMGGAVASATDETDGLGEAGETGAPVASRQAEPILAYVPLDNRPVNVDRVIYEAESAGFTVMMPDADLYTTRLDGQPLNANGTPYGDGEKLLEWIMEMDALTDYFVISLDQLLSGGLVNSRTIASRRYNDEFKMIEQIVALSQNNHVYIVDTVVRLAACTIDYQGATLEQYNYLREYSAIPRANLQGNALTIERIVAGYRRDAGRKEIRLNSDYAQEVRDMLRVRERKLHLIDHLLAKDAAGRIKYFIGVDDSSAAVTIQTNEIKYIETKMAERGRLFSGTDELGMMAALALMIDYYDYNVNVAATYYGGTEDTSSGSVFDIETVRENVEKHIESIGATLTDATQADLELVVLTEPAYAVMSVQYINGAIDHINRNIDQGIPTIVINSNPGAYGGNLEFRMIRECEMSMLLAYSSWNTVGNAIGLALCNGVSRYLYLYSRDMSTDAADIAFMKGLAFSFAKDISYQRGGGRTMFNNYLAVNGWSSSNFYESDEQVAKINADIEEIFKTQPYNVTVPEIIDNLTGRRYFKGLGGECGIIGAIDFTRYSAPFFRTFEIRFDIDVALSAVTMGRFDGGATVSIPYAPGDGLLTYALTLYYLDEWGNVVEVPSEYDRDLGRVRFSTDRLPRFFTRALTMEQERAYALYADVPASAWYFDAVLYAHEKGLMRGVTDDLFQPDAPMSRAMMIQAIYNMEALLGGGIEAVSGHEAETLPGDGVENIERGPAPLPPDVIGAWYEPAIAWAIQNDIAAPDANGNFNPNAPVTREQLGDMLWRYAVYLEKGDGNGGFPGLSHYADAATASEDTRRGLDWACRAGFLSGFGDGNIWPQAATSRAAAAAVLMRFSEWADDGVQ